MMTALYLSLSLLSALGFYLSSAHQQLVPAALPHAGVLRVAAWTGIGAAVVAAVVPLGPWAGIFSALTALMLALVLLPYLDAARQLRKQARS